MKKSVDKNSCKWAKQGLHKGKDFIIHYCSHNPKRVGSVRAVMDMKNCPLKNKKEKA